MPLVKGMSQVVSKTRLSCRNSLRRRMGSIAELREEMLILEKYWERGVELHSVGVLDGEEFGEWGAVCMSAMLLMGIGGLEFVLKAKGEPWLPCIELSVFPPPSCIG